MRPSFGWPAFFAAVTAAQIACAAIAHRNEETYLPGDCQFYAAAAVSLLRDGDLDLVNQFYEPGVTTEDALRKLTPAEAENFALSAGGKLTIKQSPLLAAAAVPFYAAFGPIGFLIFNLVVLDLLLVGLVHLAGNGSAARAVVFLGFITTGVWRYSYNFSPDLALCGLTVGGLLAARSGRPAWAGLACGLAVSLKLYAAAFLLPVPLLAVAAAGPGRRARAAVLAVAGGVVGLLPGAGFHTWQFGAPWITGYERQLSLANGRVGLADHSSKFVVPPLDGFRELIVHPTLGLAWSAPLWFLWPIPAAALLAGRIPTSGGRGWVAAAVAVILLNLALFSAYDGALIGSTHVNRYLFPAVLLGFAVMAAAAEGCTRRPASIAPIAPPADSAR